MHRTEETELTVLCLVHDGDRILLQDRVSDDWKGYTLPGGHIEQGESIVDACIREIKEETGLDIQAPRLCGVKQFPLRDGDYRKGRYIVFLFEADRFSGELVSSDEGDMHWVDKNALDSVPLVDDLHDLLEVMMSDRYSEFQYIVNSGEWNIVKK
ncbi:MAG: 8-oxo-dGTP diphosphatase [Ruminococcus sp.]|nr:8-oxo-dGTP diphosphatase [Ruminococcus sp.]